jgi:nucleotide-binding universal stress UspA family protein
VLGRSCRGEPPPALGSLGRLGAYHLECSVLVVDRAPDSVREIVLGLDGSPSAREAVRLLSGLGFAAPPRVRALTVVGAWRGSPALENIPPAPASALDEIQAQETADAQTLLARATIVLGGRAHVDGKVATGNPAEVLLEAAHRHRAELLAVGHQGLEAVRRLTLGSVAAQVLAAAPCSLLIGRK